MPFGGYNGFQPRYIAENTYIDEWGTTYQHNESAWPIDAPIDYPIKSHDDLKRCGVARSDAAGPHGDAGRIPQLDHDNLAMCPGITGPFTTCWLLMGYERICYALYDDPSLLTEIFRLSNEYNKEAARLAVAAGADAIWIGDDLGDSRSGFMKMNHFRKYYLPYLADLVEYVDSLGVPVLLHCCGHFIDYLPDLAQTKISAIHPLQRTAGMDLRWVKENYGKRFCIIGNIDSSRTLPLRHAGRGDGRGARGDRHRRAGRWLRPGLRSLAARRHPGREHPGPAPGRAGVRRQLLPEVHRERALMAMTSKQRMLTALERGIADRLPVTTHHLMPYFLDKYMGGMSNQECFEHFGLDPITWIVPHRPDPAAANTTIRCRARPASWRAGASRPTHWRVEWEDVPGQDYATTRYRFVTPKGTLTHGAPVQRVHDLGGRASRSRRNATST